MGFTWENDLQFALKRAKAGELLLGGAAEHRARDRRGVQELLMQLTFDSDVEEFRAEFAAFLDEHLPSDADTLERPRSVVAHARSGRATGSGCCSTTAGCCPRNRRSSAAATPTVVQQFVHLDELCRRRIYHSFNPQGVNIIAASLISFGIRRAEAPLGGAGAARRDSPRRSA